MFGRILLFVAFLTPVHVQAGALSGTKTITLLAPSGAAHTVGTIDFTEEPGGVTYSITWEDNKFGDHFLSMRPFKCLEGPEKYWCRVPYPYEIKRTVSADDLTDLEYDLLFLWKGATEYGINMWNGVYYRLSIVGEAIVGEIHEMDMDTLSAPPEEGNTRPVTNEDLEPGDPESHWLPRLTIE